MRRPIEWHVSERHKGEAAFLAGWVATVWPDAFDVYGRISSKPIQWRVEALEAVEQPELWEAGESNTAAEGRRQAEAAIRRAPNRAAALAALLIVGAALVEDEDR